MEKCPHPLSRKEIMDALSESHPSKIVVFCKSVQIGGSEAGYNAIGNLDDGVAG